MLSSIHPLGERGKGNRFAVTATAFVVGAVIGGTSVGAALAVIGLAADAVVGDTVALAVVSTTAVVAAVFERTGRRLPSIPRQVDENWLNEYRGWVYGAGFGFQLGAGVLTFITTAAVYVALVAAVFVGHPLAATGIVAAFGLARGLTLVPARAIRSPQELLAFHRRLQRSAAAVRIASSSVLALSGIVAGAVLIQDLS
jgi:hypothetical protein